ncbi:MAG: TIGR02452 family protein [Treponema sp.]|nr:TIGR02452 family protein [Treponema sp.]
MDKKLIAVFNDTLYCCESEVDLAIQCRRSIENQIIYYDEDDVEGFETNRNTKANPMQILVSKKRSFEAAGEYRNLGANICVLNFASSLNPGGGVTSGSKAQEECLCRCSTLYKCLTAKDCRDYFYDPHIDDLDYLYNDDIIYTPNVVVFKSDEDLPERLPVKDRFMVNVITCAAPNIKAAPKGSDAISDEKLSAIFKKRIRRIMEVAVANENDILIAGAFGCGVFGNSPELVADAFKDVLKDFTYDLSAVEFAVFCKDGKTENYEAFKKVFSL